LTCIVCLIAAQTMILGMAKRSRTPLPGCQDPFNGQPSQAPSWWAAQALRSDVWLGQSERTDLLQASHASGAAVKKLFV
jgi:hypothetical protein